MLTDFIIRIDDMAYIGGRGTDTYSILYGYFINVHERTISSRCDDTRALQGRAYNEHSIAYIHSRKSEELRTFQNQNDLFCYRRSCRISL